MNEWNPGGRELVAMQVLSVAAVFVGVLVYLFGYALTHALDGVIDLAGLGVGLALLVAGLAVVVVVHEGIHGLVMLPFGAMPRFGFTTLAGAVPAFSCTADGHRFTQAQFTWIALAPTVVLGLGVLVLQPWAGLWLVGVAVFHLSGCVGDWVMASVAGRQPRGTLIEDLETGLRFHPPHRPDAS